MNWCALLLAVFSIWDYPQAFPKHEQLRWQFTTATRRGDTATMEKTCRLGVKLLPDDPTWHYNLACSLAYFPNRTEEAFDELETAIDLGFRDRKTIAADVDLKRLEKLPRYQACLEYADYKLTSPLRSGPLSAVSATGVFGKPIVLGGHNLGWDFDVGCFVAKMQLAVGSSQPNVGDLYMNRDNMHAALRRNEFQGLTWVSLDAEGTNRHAHLDFPNMRFPYPLFGNCSRALVSDPRRPNPYWRSLPRAMMTIRKETLGRMVKFYLSNQTWVYPANADLAPIGTNGDVFASITPYWLTTAGRSWSDLPYLRDALWTSGWLTPSVKAELVRRELLAPTIQTLIRKSLKGVTSEDDYLTARAHPTALPAGGVETNRLCAAARALTVAAIPPLVPIAVEAAPGLSKAPQSELTYGSAFAWAYVLRSDDEVRTFTITARGADEFAFRQTHGAGVDVKIEKVSPNVAKVTLNRAGLSPTNRVDILVCGRNPGTGWGAPSYVSFARMDPDAPYSDPALTRPNATPAK